MAKKKAMKRAAKTKKGQVKEGKRLTALDAAAYLGHRTGEGSFPVTQRDRHEARAAVVTHSLQQRPQALTLRDSVPFLPVVSEQPLLLELFRHKALYHRRR